MLCTDPHTILTLFLIVAIMSTIKYLLLPQIRASRLFSLASTRTTTGVLFLPLDH
jgi:hypothetical protein